MTNYTLACAKSQAVTPPRLFLNLPIEVAQLPLRPAAKLIYGALKMHCRQKDVCRVRWTILQAETGLSRASVARALADLRREGLVGTLRTGRSSYYVLYPASAPESDKQPPAPAAGAPARAEGEPTPGPVKVDEPAYTRPHTPRPDTLNVENAARSQVAHFHKRDFAKASTSTNSIPKEVPSTERETPDEVGDSETKPLRVLKAKNTRIIPQTTEIKQAEKQSFSPMYDPSGDTPSQTPGIAPLIAFLSAPVQEGGLGWRCHRGNEERVVSYVARVGLEAATQSAYRCFDQGEHGGAALWDWTLSQAGFHRQPQRLRRRRPWFQWRIII